MSNLAEHNAVNVVDASRLVLELRSITQVTDLTNHVTRIIRIVGGEVFVFHTRISKEGGKGSHHYLIGCPPDFCQQYNARKWRSIDPILNYSDHHMRPVQAHEFDLLSPGQTELLNAAKRAGFVANINIPVRHESTSRLGVLYVGASEKSKENTLYGGQGLLLHLAYEMLDWVARYVRQQELGEREVSVDNLDKHIMRYCYQGFTAEQIAELCEVPVSRVRNRMRRHNEKFHTSNHKGAVRRAIEMGLLRVN